MNIGPTSLKHGLILAPMAGFTDRAMRLVCHEWGAEYTVTEMVSAKAVQDCKNKRGRGRVCASDIRKRP